MNATILQQLLSDNSFHFVSFARGSIPTVGSPCVEKRNLRDDLPVERVIRHKTGHVTLKVSGGGFVKFWKEKTA